MGATSAIAAVTDALASSGWTKDAVISGGRTRFVCLSNGLRCTVGKRSVSFYRVVDGKAVDFRNYSTARDLEYIRAAAGVSSPAAMPETPRDVADRADRQAHEDWSAALREENERRLQERLRGGERVLIGSGEYGQVFRRMHGLVVVLHADRDTELEACCIKRANYLTCAKRRNRCVAGPDEHSSDCEGER